MPSLIRAHVLLCRVPGHASFVFPDSLAHYSLSLAVLLLLLLLLLLVLRALYHSIALAHAQLHPRHLPRGRADTSAGVGEGRLPLFHGVRVR